MGRQEETRQGLSRRDFLRQSALAAGGLAAGGAFLNVLGCGGPGGPAPAATSPAAAAAPTAAKAGAAKATGPINWLAWSTHANPDVMGNFERETGIKVNLIAFDANSDAFAKLQQAGAQAGQLYDLVEADGYWPLLYQEKGYIEPLNLDEFESAKTLLPQFRNYKLWSLPDGRLVQYPDWYSPEGILYRKDKFPTPPDSWEAIFDPKYQGRILWNAGPDYSLPIGALVLGYPDPYNLTSDQFQRVIDKFKKAKPYVKVMVASTGEVTKAFLSGEVDIGLGAAWGPVYLSWKEKGPELGYVVPKEGTVGWIDGDMLVKGAAHAEAAKLFINYQHRPDNAAKRGLATGYAGSNAKAIEILKASGPEGAKIVEVNQVDTVDQWLPKMQLLKPPPDPSLWVQAWNEVKAS